MTRYPLLPQRRMSQRMRWKLVLLGFVMPALGVYDRFDHVLGPNWYFLWLGMGPVVILWVYYALLLPRAAIYVTPEYIRLHGPLYGRKLSQKRVVNVSPGKLEQHYPYRKLSLGERPILKPFHQTTCAFIELSSYPKAFKRRRLWFPRTLFATEKPGLLCYVDDWMALSHELDSIHSRQQTVDLGGGRQRHMSLAARILAEDIQFD
jgi:hypothetical protein